MTLPIDRKTAKERGEKFYTPDFPCKRGHISKRYTVNGSCFDCCSITTGKYYIANKESLKSHVYNHRKVNGRNKLKDSVRTKAWKKDNHEKVKCYRRNRRARDSMAEGYHDDQDIRSIYIAQNGKCAGCNKRLKFAYHIDHITALSNGGTNWPRNLQMLCANCNLTKHAKDPIVWAREKGRLL